MCSINEITLWCFVLFMFVSCVVCCVGSGLCDELINC